MARFAHPLQLAGIVFALVAFAAHASQALAGAYLSYVSGIWLALGHDLSAGVFYRDLLSDIGYGGTRYFPLFFSLIGLLMHAGLPPLAAGWSASAAAAMILTTGLYRVARVLGLSVHVALLVGVGGLAPYFVQQTLFEVRADVLAAGLNLWGLSYTVAAWRRDDGRPGMRPGWAATGFTLAFATKVTSLAVPLSAIAGLVLAGRSREARRLALWLTGGVVLFFVIVDVLSAGRAVASWRACMFAGANAGGTLTALLGGEFLALAAYSHFLAAMLAIVAVGMLVAAIAEPRAGESLWCPAMVFLGVTGATALTLSSPGTVPSNQVVEWIVISFVVLAWIAAARPRLHQAVTMSIVVVVVWASVQDLVRVRALWHLRSNRTSAATMQQIVNLVADAPGPVLAESSLWPVLAGQQPYLLDPFALRVVFGSRPDIFRDLAARIDARAFPIVIFQVDPTSSRGRGYYEHVNFGWPITERILANYRFDSQPARDVYLYVPR